MLQTQEDRQQIKPDRLGIVFYGITWAFVGALYAALFMPLFEVVRNLLPVWAAAICATVAATAGGALVYSSAQLALMVAFVSNFAVFALLLYSGEMTSPLAPVTVGAGTGAIVGALYALIVKESRIYSAEAKLLAGVTVGSIVSVVSLIWILIFNASLTVLVVVLAPLSGLIYERIVNNFVQRFSDIFPPVADGAVAGLVIGGFIGFGLWLVSGIVLENAIEKWRDVISIISESTPIAIASAGASTFIMGMLYEAFRSKFGGFQH